jgi:tetratricopeptide (TPR) repeat protein
LAENKIGNVFFHTGEENLYMWDILRVLNLAEKIGNPKGMAHGYVTMAIIAGFVPIHFLAEMYLRLAWRAVEATDDLSTRAYVLARDGLYRNGLGDWPVIHDKFEQAIEIFQRLDDQRQWEENAGQLAELYHQTGKFAESIELWAEVQQVAEHGDHTQAHTWSLWGQGQSLLRRGQIAEAGELLEAAGTAATENGDNISETISNGVLAAAYLRQNRPERALQAAKRQQKLAPKSPVVHSTLEGYVGAVETFLTLWEAEAREPEITTSEQVLTLQTAARQTLKSIHAHAKRFPIGQSSAQLYQGLYDWLAGKPAKAHKAWEKSLAAAEQLEMPYEQGRAHYEIARHLDKGVPTRAEHLKHAGKIFEKLGASYDLARVKELEA